MATREEARPHRRPPLKLAVARRAGPYAGAPRTGVAPVVAAAEPQTARVTAGTAARLARRLGASLVFVSVRPRRPALLNDRHPERRWIQDMLRSRKALDVALATASRNGVMAYGEILEGDDAVAIGEFAKARSAQLLVGASGAHPTCPASSDASSPSHRSQAAERSN
jgi:nucleotide-binding universal stress UspA family protein